MARAAALHDQAAFRAETRTGSVGKSKGLLYREDMVEQQTALLGSTNANTDYKGDDGGHEGKSSAFRAAYNVICTVVGAGLLQIPYGLNQSGWVGIPILLVMAAMACYTAIVLIRCLELPDGRKLKTYGDIGEAAFGVFGKWFVNIQMHITLTGVATIYLVLAGLNLYGVLIPGVPDHNFAQADIAFNQTVAIVIIACVVWFHVFFKTLHEVGIISTFNVLVALILAVLVIVSVALQPAGTTVTHSFVGPASALGGAFASFAFAFGAHPILPSVRSNMANKEQYPKMIMITFVCVLLFYLTVGITGYGAYGDLTDSPIYNNFCPLVGPCSIGMQSSRYVAVLLVTIHVMFSCGIVLNPTELALEGLFKIEGKPAEWPMRLLLRTLLLAACTGVAIGLPNFPDFLELVSSFTNTFTLFILPCAFYMKLYWKQVSVPEIIWCIAIIAVALVGGTIGTIGAIQDLMCDIGHIGCPPS